jgi:cysteine synthase
MTSQRRSTLETTIDTIHRQPKFLDSMASCSKVVVLNNSNAKVDVQGVQPMRCVMCHSFKNSNASSQSSTKFQKGFITYNLEHGIMAMNKHVTNEHGLNLVKYTVHKTGLEGKDSSKK